MTPPIKFIFQVVSKTRKLKIGRKSFFHEKLFHFIDFISIYAAVALIVIQTETNCLFRFSNVNTMHYFRFLLFSYYHLIHLFNHLQHFLLNSSFGDEKVERESNLVQFPKKEYFSGYAFLANFILQNKQYFNVKTVP